jgi:hypothetical protein
MYRILYKFNWPDDGWIEPKHVATYTLTKYIKQLCSTVYIYPVNYVTQQDGSTENPEECFHGVVEIRMSFIQSCLLVITFVKCQRSEYVSLHSYVVTT